ncbi:MAG: UDP-glucose/GDP-mannose dehydrogenase family protein [Candidatus Rokubacteria bacterium]|nr:UDP-glucose/GDP-mannose dehydrogenase family protein [Candidatus Rokubacteria bacterium]
MTIGIIGYGVVGSTTAEMLRRLGHTVAVRDTDPGRMEEARAEGFAELDQDASPDVLFICVREGHVRDVLRSAPDSPVTVIRSTVPPGTTEDLSEELGRPLLFMPEILREATALWDALNPNLILIGCRSKEEGERLAELLAPLMAPIVLVPPSTAEMVKLTLNAYFHTLISFWNEIHLICELTGLQSHVVGKLCSQDPRVSPYGATMHGRPAGGTCLPKDLAQLIDFAERKGYAPEFLGAVKNMNSKVAGYRVEVAKNGHRPRKSPGRRLAGAGRTG